MNTIDNMFLLFANGKTGKTVLISIRSILEDGNVPKDENNTPMDLVSEEVMDEIRGEYMKGKSI